MKTPGEAPTPLDVEKDKVFSLLAVESPQDFLIASEDYIANRLAFLENASQPCTVSVLTPRHKGFIHPETEIRPQPLVPGYTVNDPEAYTALFAVMKDFHAAPGWGDPDRYRKLVLFSTQYGLDAYFGGSATSAAQQERRTSQIWAQADIVSDDEPGLASIKDYKEIALCAERAAVANNMLSLLGVDTEYVVGELQIDDGKPESHAFLLLVNSSGKKIIYDPTHPEIIEANGGRTMRPMVGAGGEALLSGGTVQLPHRDITPREGIETATVKQYRYTLGPGMLFDRAA